MRGRLTAAVFLVDSVPALFVGRVLSGLSAGVFTGVATTTIVELAISIPVVGVGVGTAVLGLVPAAVAFTGFVAALALGAFVSLLRRTGETG